MTERILCRSAADLVVATTGQLGFRPHDSLVLLPLEGRTAIGLMRVDLPAAEIRRDPGLLADYADRVAGTLMRLEGITSMAAIVYASSRGAGAPHGDVVAAVASVAHRAGIAPASFAFVAADSWGTLDRHRPTRVRCRPLDELGGVADLPISATRPFVGLTAPFAPVLDDRAPRLAGLDDAQAVERLVGEAPPRLHPDDAASLHHRAVRIFGDVDRLCEILPLVAFDGVVADLDDVWRDTLDDDHASPVRGAALRGAFDPDRCERALSLLEASVDAAAPPLRQSVCAAIGWLCWALGRGSPAAGWCGLALRDEPDHPLAALVEACSAHGIVPPWFGKPPARVRDAAA